MSTRFKPEPGSTVRVSRNGSISIERGGKSIPYPSRSPPPPSSFSTLPTSSTSSSSSSLQNKPSSPNLSHRYSSAVARFERRLQQTSELYSSPSPSPAAAAPTTYSSTTTTTNSSSSSYGHNTRTTTPSCTSSYRYNNQTAGQRYGSSSNTSPFSSSSSPVSPTSKWRDHDEEERRSHAASALERARQLVRNYDVNHSKQKDEEEEEEEEQEKLSPVSTVFVEQKQRQSSPTTPDFPTMSSPSPSSSPSAAVAAAVEEEEEKAEEEEEEESYLPENTDGATAAFLEPMKLTGDTSIVQHIHQTLEPIVSEHRRLFTAITKGIHCMVVS